MKYFLLTLFLFYYSSTYGYYTLYSCQEYEDTYVQGLSLVMDSANNYIISVNTYSEAQGPFETRLSVGKYDYYNGVLTLTDNISNYKMVLRKKNKDFRLETGYHFLLNKTFKFIKHSSDSANFAYQPFSKNIREKEEHAITISGIYSVRGGDKFFSYWQGTWIEFKGKSYNVYFGKALLSKGTFTMANNKIILTDVVFNKNFTLLVVNKTLIVAEDFISPFYEYRLTTRKQDRSKKDDSLFKARAESGVLGR